jgi:hypothetical protein
MCLRILESHQNRDISRTDVRILASEMRHHFTVFMAKYLEKSVQSWARIIIPLVKDAAEWNRLEILRGVNVESMTRGDPQITRPRERHMGPSVRL